MLKLQNMHDTLPLLADYVGAVALISLCHIRVQAATEASWAWAWLGPTLVRAEGYKGNKAFLWSCLQIEFELS